MNLGIQLIPTVVNNKPFLWKLKRSEFHLCDLVSSFRLKEIPMTITTSNVSVGSTPHFVLNLQDVDHSYFITVALYKVQAQNAQTLEWQDVGDITELTPESNQVDIYLTSAQTALVEGCNNSRRLVVQVQYSDNGQTLSSIQAIDFILNSLPVLSEEFTPSSAESDVVSSGVTSTVEASSRRVLVELSNPVDSVSSVTYEDSGETLDADYYLLSRNSSLLIFLPVGVTSTTLTLKYKVLSTLEEKTLVITLY